MEIYQVYGLGFDDDEDEWVLIKTFKSKIKAETYIENRIKEYKDDNPDWMYEVENGVAPLPSYKIESEIVE